jgi:hypothetical protein
MTGLWKEWKAKQQASHSSHESPWKSRPKPARFPHSHSSDDEGGWKSGKPKTRFPTFPPPRVIYISNKEPERGGFALRAIQAPAWAGKAE